MSEEGLNLLMSDYEKDRHNDYVFAKQQQELDKYKQALLDIKEYIEENMKDSQLVFGINDINRLYVKYMNDLLDIVNKALGDKEND